MTSKQVFYYFDPSTVHEKMIPRFSHRRLDNEFKTIKAMLKIYCRDHHSHADQDTLCPECLELQTYAARRLAGCPFQEDKPTCGNCLIHCYKKDMRKKIQDVMRYSGPRMIYRHPFMALRHLLDSKRKPPKLKKGPQNP